VTTSRSRGPAWRRYLRFWGSNIRDDVSDELAFHVEMRAAEYVARGMSANEARRLAEQRFGDAKRARDACVEIQERHGHAAGRAELRSIVGRDVRFAARMLRRQALPSLVAALCIALGIGATTAMFSIGSALLVRPLPYPAGDRLVQIGSGRNSERRAGMTVSSLPDLTDWRTRQRSFTNVAGIWQMSLTIASGQPFRVSGAAVTGNMFETLGVTAEVGRVLRESDEQPGAEPVAVVARRFALRRLGGTESVVGRRLRIAGARRTIVGIIPDRWAYPDFVDVWLPLGRNPIRESRGNRYLQVVAQLKPNVTPAMADREMAAIGRELRRENPEGDADITPFVTPLREIYVGPARSGLVALGLGTLLILVVACANVAALQLARASSRAREIAVRTAIGAARWRIFTQLLIEAALLATAGGAAGVGIAFAARTLVATAVAPDVPKWMTFDIDALALAFATCASLLAAVTFGIAPAVRLTRIDPAGALHGMRSVLGIDRGRLQRAFLAVELALSIVLVIGAELAVESIMRLRNVPLGFETKGVTTFRINMQGQRYDSREERTRVMKLLADRIAALPDVASVSATTYAPGAGCCSQFGTTIADHPMPPGKRLMVTGNIVLPGSFKTIGTPVLAGRDFTAADDANAPRVVIISQTFAKQFWPSGDALGHLIDTGGGMAMIVGIVGDVKQGRVIDDPEPQFYRPYAQDPWSDMDMLVRTKSSASLSAAEVRGVARDIDPIALPISRMSTLQQRIDTSIASKQVLGTLLAVLAVVALALATIGVYAVMSFFVSQRTKELGLRLALGAEPVGLLAYVMRQMIGVATVGSALGVGGGILVARSLQHLMFGVRAAEPLVYVFAAGTLVLATIAASYGPARRASAADPMLALRVE
jgi:putative ABC transport system permease protein